MSRREPHQGVPSSSGACKVDPLREKLKAWQASHGRIKENRLPWQPRFTKSRQRSLSPLSPSKSKRPSSPALPKRKESIVSSVKAEVPKSVSANAERPLTKIPKKSLTLKQKNFKENQKLYLDNGQKGKKKDVRKEEIFRKMENVYTKNREPIKSQIPRQVVASIRKSPINFIQLNKKLVAQFRNRGRRITVADVNLRGRRLSLEKIKCHSIQSNKDYYCLRPSISRKLAIQATSRQTSPDFKQENQVNLDEQPIFLNEEDNISWPKKLLNSDASVQEPVFALPPKPPESKFVKKGRISHDVTSKFNSESMSIVASTPINSKEHSIQTLRKTPSKSECDNFQVKFLVSPARNAPDTNIFSLTPVRRSIRFPSRKSSDVFDCLNEIPSNVMTNTVYRQNPAINYLVEEDENYLIEEN